MGRSRSNHYVLPCKVKLVKTRMKWRKVNETESKMMRKQRYKQDYGRVLYTTMEWGEWGVGGTVSRSCQISVWVRNGGKPQRMIIRKMILIGFGEERGGMEGCMINVG